MSSIRNRVRRAWTPSARRDNSLTSRRRGEAGDIAGWVMITVMTIMLAGAIMTIFMPAVTDYLQSALNQFM